MIGSLVIWLVCLGGLFVLAAQEAGPRSEAERVANKATESVGDGITAIDPILPVVKKKPAGEGAGGELAGQTGVNWKGLFWQSSFFLGLQHGVRLATEPGTREGLKGPFFDNYARSVGNLHGWADGDEFYVNYIGHPLMGASAGYIFAQNDAARFKYVEFGKNRNYWKGRLRAFAYSSLYSAQFEVGPVSEASIGSIQSRYPQHGFVDIVATPTLGLGWMVAEDALDKYVIAPLERKFRNPYVNLMLRGWLNPSRSWANMMGLKVPWHRDARGGVFAGSSRKEAEARFLAANRGDGVGATPVDRERAEAVVSPFEFDVAFQPSTYLGGQGISCLGGASTGAFRLASRMQFVADVGGCNLMGLPANWSGDSLHYLGGVRWVPWASQRWSSHVQVLAGGEKMTQERMYPEKKKLLYEQWRLNGSIPEEKPRHEEYTIGIEANAFAMQTGLGVSYRMNSAVQWRLASVDYRRSWLPMMNGGNYRNSLSLTTGITLRMGSW